MKDLCENTKELLKKWGIPIDQFSETTKNLFIILTLIQLTNKVFEKIAENKNEQ